MIFNMHLHTFKSLGRDFPGGPAFKPSPSNAGGVCLIPGWGTKIPHDKGPNIQNIKWKRYCNKFNKDFLREYII